MGDYHPLNQEACDWLYKLLGLCFIQDHMDELNFSQELKEEVKRVKSLTVKHLKELCKSAKNNESLKGDDMFRQLEKVFCRDFEYDDVEKAKKLLESKGFRIEKD